jgi:hypothetical protein
VLQNYLNLGDVPALTAFTVNTAYVGTIGNDHYIYIAQSLMLQQYKLNRAQNYHFDIMHPCIHSSVYTFESGYISPSQSFRFLPKHRQGGHFVIVSIQDSSFNTTVLAARLQDLLDS